VRVIAEKRREILQKENSQNQTAGLAPEQCSKVGFKQSILLFIVSIYMHTKK